MAVVGVLLMALTVVTYYIVNAANAALRESQRAAAISEATSQARQTNDSGKRTLASNMANQIGNYSGGTAVANSTLLANPPLSLGTINTNQGASFTRTVTSQDATRSAGPGGAFQNIGIPPGAAAIFGGTGSFIGRQLTGTFTDSSLYSDLFSKTQTPLSESRQIDIYEFPATGFALSGGEVTTAGETIPGSILAERLFLQDGTSVGRSVAITKELEVNGSADIAGAIVSDLAENATAALAKDLEEGIYGDNVGPEISIFRPSEESALVILSDQTRDGEGVPQNFRRTAGTPTPFQAWCLPAYQCETRLLGQLINSGAVIGGQFARVLVYRRSNTSPPASWATESLVGSYDIVPGQAVMNGMTLEMPNGPANPTRVLVVDPVSLSTSGLGVNATSVFAQLLDQSGQIVGSGNHAVGLRPAVGDLGALPAFSIVSPNRLYIDGDVNAPTKPVSILAPEIRFGLLGSPSSVRVSGQKAMLGTSGNRAAFAVLGSNGSPLPVSQRTVVLNDITNPAMVPPVFIRGLMIRVGAQ